MTTDQLPWEPDADTEISENDTEDDSLDDILDSQPIISASRAKVRERLYKVKGPKVKLNKELPKVEENALVMLREHIRMLKGKSPKLIRKRKLVCWQDSPEMRPKLNQTHHARYNHIKSKTEDRKDSEEDPFSNRCAK